MTHAYDNASLSDLEFLTAVRNDKYAPMTDRIKAAEYLLLIKHGLPLPTVTIKIYGLGDLELREWFDAQPYADREEVYRACARLERCNDLDIGDLNLMRTKGNA